MPLTVLAVLILVSSPACATADSDVAALDGDDVGPRDSRDPYCSLIGGVYCELGVYPACVGVQHVYICG